MPPFRSARLIRVDWSGFVPRIFRQILDEFLVRDLAASVILDLLSDLSGLHVSTTLPCNFPEVVLTQQPGVTFRWVLRPYELNRQEPSLISQPIDDWPVVLLVSPEHLDRGTVQPNQIAGHAAPPLPLPTRASVVVNTLVSTWRGRNCEPRSKRLHVVR